MQYICHQGGGEIQAKHMDHGLLNLLLILPRLLGFDLGRLFNELNEQGLQAHSVEKLHHFFSA